MAGPVSLESPPRKILIDPGQRVRNVDQELVLATQMPFDLGDHGLRRAQVLQGAVQGFGGPLRLAPITLKTFMGM